MITGISKFNTAAAALIAGLTVLGAAQTAHAAPITWTGAVNND